MKKMQKSINQFFTKFSATAVLLGLILAIPFQSVQALADPLPGFNPSGFITNEIFSDTNSMAGPCIGRPAGYGVGQFDRCVIDQIQAFLVNKGSILANQAPEFITMLKEPDSAPMLCLNVPKTTKECLGDPRPNLPTKRSAADLIWDAVKASGSAAKGTAPFNRGLNPQVLLVMLQKEQSLIGNSLSNAQVRLDKALGMGCPDTAACDPNLLGFYNQLFGFALAPNNGPYVGGPGLLIRNAALGNGPGIDYSVGRTGVAMVGSTPPIKNETQYWLDQGYKVQPAFNVPDAQLVTMSNGAIASLYRYTPWVYNGNYNVWRYMKEYFGVDAGVPKDGTIVKAQNSPAVWLVENQKLKPFGGLTTLAQYGGWSWTSGLTGVVKIYPDTMINSLEKVASVVPMKDGILITAPKTGYTMFSLEAGKRQVLTKEVLISRYCTPQPGKTLDARCSNAQATIWEMIRPIYFAVNDIEAESVPMGTLAAPAVNTFYKTSTDKKYQIQANHLGQPVRREIYSWVESNRGSISYLFTIDNGLSEQWALANALPPQEFSLKKQVFLGKDKQTIYKVVNQTFVPYSTYDQYVADGSPQVVIVPVPELEMMYGAEPKHQ